MTNLIEVAFKFVDYFLQAMLGLVFLAMGLFILGMLIFNISLAPNFFLFLLIVGSSYAVYKMYMPRLQEEDFDISLVAVLGNN